VTRHRSYGIPLGTRYGYACSGCKRRFEIESMGRVVFKLVGGAMVLAMGIVLLVDRGQSPIAPILCCLMGLWMVYSAWRRSARAIHNPLVE
jgi:hypothetical protein